MIENQEKIEASLEEIWGEFVEKYPRASEDAINKLLLREVNLVAARRDILLNLQSKTIKGILLKQLSVHNSVFSQSMSISDFAVGIYDELEFQMNKETAAQKLEHAAQGHFSSRKIHERKLIDQLQDDDMTRFMPCSRGNIDVLGVVNQLDRANDEIIIEGLRVSLADSKIKHIIAPVGPGHWRGMYLTKPAKPGEKYTLELFDPYGDTGAIQIEEFVLGLLQSAGLTSDQIVVEYKGPNIAQKDGYACGDFTCAYSHKKMKEFGALAGTGYNQFLIDVLDKKGNINHALRHAVHQISAGKVLPVGDGSSSDDLTELCITASPPAKTRTIIQSTTTDASKVKSVDLIVDSKKEIHTDKIEKLVEIQTAKIKQTRKLEQLAPIFEQIKALETKAEEFPAKRKEVKAALTKVSTDLRLICLLYQTNQINLIEFKENAHTLLTDETSESLTEIKKHRGCKKILANLLAILVTGPFAHIAHCIWTSSLTLFHPDTRSFALVKEVDEVVTNMTDDNTDETNDESKPDI